VLGERILDPAAAIDSFLFRCRRPSEKKNSHRSYPTANPSGRANFSGRANLLVSRILIIRFLDVETRLVPGIYEKRLTRRFALPNRKNVNI
jgi:hypothetical protein